MPPEAQRYVNHGESRTFTRKLFWCCYQNMVKEQQSLCKPNGESKSHDINLKQKPRRLPKTLEMRRLIGRLQQSVRKVFAILNFYVLSSSTRTQGRLNSLLEMTIVATKN